MFLQACRRVLALLVLLHFLPEPVFPYFMNNNQIRDLEANDGSFNTEAAAWTLSSYNAGPKTSICGGAYLLGGYEILGGTRNQYFERKYSNLPGHTAIYFSFKIWIIDSWDDGDNDHFDVYFDGTTLNGPIAGHDWYDISSLYDLCGTQGTFWNGYHKYKDLPSVIVTGTVAHSASTLTFRVVSQLDEDTGDESFGIREVSFMFLQTTKPYTTGLCTSAAINLGTDCSCPAGLYASAATNPPTCSSCHNYCSTCYGATESDCYGCKSPYVWDGAKCIQCDANCNGCYGEGNTKCLSCAANKYSYKTSTCLDSCNSPLKATGYQCDTYCSTNQFLYWDNTCSPTCDFPLRRSSSTSTSLSNIIIMTCTYPCAAGEFLYWDGICRSSCDPPLNQRTTQSQKFCDFLCSSPTPIRYWNSTCSSTCPFPLSYANTYGKEFCQYPCATGQYLYNNGSCIVSPCRQYFKSYSYNIENRCDYPCLSTHTLYSNGTCLPQPCQKWYKSFTIATDQECRYPCLSTENLYNNGSCLATCDPRFTLHNSNAAEKHCDYRCTTSQYLFLNNTCLDNCPPYYNAWFDKITGDKYCDRPCQPGEHLYSNGSCLSTCQTYYKPVVYTSDKFCNYPCKPNEYLYSNGTCITYCHPHFSPVNIGQDKFCNYPCASTEYLSYDGKCVSACDPLIYQVQTYGTDKFCYFRCKVGDYFYKNGTCSSSCPSGFNVITNGEYRFCNYPCASSEHFYDNGTCLTSCDPHFIPNTYSGDKFCSFPCSTNNYLHDNGTCLSSCNALFVKTIVSDGKEQYCHYPCSSLSDHIYWNGTCLPSCVSPYQPYIEGSYKFCLYACPSYEYLYWNSTCHRDCNFPLVSRTQSGLKYCDYPCSATQYLLWNGSCASSCEFPYRIKNQAVGTLCVLPCDDHNHYYYEDTGKCKAQCDMKAIVHDGLFRKCVAYDPTEGEFIKFLSTPSEEIGSVTLTALPKTIHYLRYANVSYPLRVQRIAHSKGMNPVSYVHLVPLTQQSVLQPTRHQISFIYDKYNLSSSFIVNFWPEILMLGGIIVLIIILFTLEIAFYNLGLIFWQNLCKRVRTVFGWNIAIMLITINISDIILYSTLELRTLEFDSITANISFLICFATIGATVGILFLTGVLGTRVYIMQQGSVKAKSPSVYAKMLNDWRGYQVVYRGFRDNKLADSLFYLAYVIRRGLPMMIALSLSLFPMVQTSLYVLISVAILGYIISRKPIKKPINHIQLIMVELLMLVINIGIFLLALLDSLEVENSSARAFIGDTIVVCSFLLNILAPVFLVAKLYKAIRSALKLKQTDAEKSNAILLQALFIPVQQAGFGFEQVQMVSFSNIYTTLPQVAQPKSNSLWESFKRLFKTPKNSEVGNSANNVEMSQETNRQFLNNTLHTQVQTPNEAVQYVSLYNNRRSYGGPLTNQGQNLPMNETSFPIRKISQKPKF